MNQPQNNPPRLLVDMSPILYSNLISVSNQMKKSGLKIDPETKKLPFTYKSELIFAVLEEVKNFKGFFGVKEIILSFDNSKGGYWRKQHYARYKYSRAKGRDESEIDWNAAFEVFNELKDFFRSSSFKVIDIPSVEADDQAFVLSKYFQDKGGVVLMTLDHDWKHTLNYENTRLFMTRKTQKKDGIYIEMTKEELETKAEEHCIAGDPGDGFLHLKSWTQFSPEFLAEYPKFKGRELDLYDKHHEIEHSFNLKHDFNSKMQAYKHPRFGYKSWKKSGKPLDTLLEENPIYKKNYELNKLLCLPFFIPDELKETIITEYENASTEQNPGKLTSYLMENRLFELTGIIQQL